jgi:hypothetical protein
VHVLLLTWGALENADTSRALRVWNICTVPFLLTTSGVTPFHSAAAHT